MHIVFNSDLTDFNPPPLQSTLKNLTQNTNVLNVFWISPLQNLTQNTSV